MRGFRRPAQAFTLIELLMSMAVLAVIIILAAQMSSSTLHTVSSVGHRLDSSEQVRVVVQKLRDELSGVVVRDTPGRYLNLRVAERESGLWLFFTRPRAQTQDLTRLSFVTHVAYVWDRPTRRLLRMEWDASRDEETVQATASTAESTDSEANLARLLKLTPAYQGNTPFTWAGLPRWEERLEEARKIPLLTGVSEWKIECFLTADFEEEEPALNVWERGDQLPLALRLRFLIDCENRPAAGTTRLGQLFTGLIPLTCAGAQP